MAAPSPHGSPIGDDLPVPADDVVTVLVVDDHAAFRRAAGRLIERIPGFRLVAEAATGEEGVEEAARQLPRLVLMDIKLPGIDGLEATRRLLAVHPAAVVVLCSTYLPADLPDGAAACGAAGYLRKEEATPDALAHLYRAAAPGATPS